MSKAVQHLQGITTQDEYGTPRWLYDMMQLKAGFTPLLDTCSNIFNPKCTKFYTINDNALSKPWDVDFFMNPPYSKVRQFVKYGYEQHLKHNVNGLVLTYAKTDTKWFHGQVYEKAEIHFIEGRLRFMDYHGNPTPHPAPYPSMWFVWRKKPDLEAFSS
jgi:site-specific DNA-methyltransferase (adenine-specific)